MSQPVQNLRDMRQLDPLRQAWAVDHQYRQAQGPRSIQLGLRPRAPGVFRNNKLRPMVLHQRAIAFLGKGTSRHNHVGLRQWHAVRLIDQPQQIMVLGLRGERLKMQATRGQKHPARRACQGGNSSRDIRNMLPRITGPGDPWRAGQRRQGDLGCSASLDGVPAHLGGKGMGGIHHMSDSVLAQMMDQPFDAAKPSDTGRQRLRAGRIHASGVGISRCSTLFGQGFGQSVGLGRTTQDQQIWDQGGRHD